MSFYRCILQNVGMWGPSICGSPVRLNSQNAPKFGPKFVKLDVTRKYHVILHKIAKISRCDVGCLSRFLRVEFLDRISSMPPHTSTLSGNTRTRYSVWSMLPSSLKQIVYTSMFKRKFENTLDEISFRLINFVHHGPYVLRRHYADVNFFYAYLVCLNFMFSFIVGLCFNHLLSLMHCILLSGNILYKAVSTRRVTDVIKTFHYSMSRNPMTTLSLKQNLTLMLTLIPTLNLY